MSREFIYDNHKEFLAKFNELVKSGIDRDNMTLYAPHPVHGLDEAVDPKKSKLRFFTFFGGLAGLLTGILFPIYTVYSWPLITGGKPMVSLPAFFVIGFELTILLGGTLSFAGFLILSKLPNLKTLLSPPEYGNKFAIVLDEKVKI